MIDKLRVPSFSITPLRVGFDKLFYFAQEWERFFLSLRKNDEDLEERVSALETASEEMESFAFFMGE